MVVHSAPFLPPTIQPQTSLAQIRYLRLSSLVGSFQIRRIQRPLWIDQWLLLSLKWSELEIGRPPFGRSSLGRYPPCHSDGLSTTRPFWRYKFIVFKWKTECLLFNHQDLISNFQGQIGRFGCVKVVHSHEPLARLWRWQIRSDWACNRRLLHSQPRQTVLTLGHPSYWRVRGRLHVYRCSGWTGLGGVSRLDVALGEPPNLTVELTTTLPFHLSLLQDLKVFELFNLQDNTTATTSMMSPLVNDRSPSFLAFHGNCATHSQRTFVVDAKILGDL